eukprot:475367-Alexandrium_andersonii.AAC.1
MVEGVPQGAVLLLVAGSPCQDLTYAGTTRGVAGVCGPQSVLFWSVPIIARVLQSLRPDANVQVLVENA